MSDGIKPLDDYLREIEATERRLRAPLGLRATTQDDNAKVRAHARAILDYYAGVQPQGSFIDAAGTVFDAIPVEQQASLRGKDVSNATGRSRLGRRPCHGRGAGRSAVVRGLAGRCRKPVICSAGHGANSPSNPEDALRRMKKARPPTARGEQRANVGF